MTTQLDSRDPWLRSALRKVLGDEEQVEAEERPSEPCPQDGGTLFWLSHSTGAWSCMTHRTPESDGDVAETYDVSSGRTQTADAQSEQFNRKSIYDAIRTLFESENDGHRNGARKLLESVERPSAPCPIDNSVAFWRSNATGLWSCAQHNYPMDKGDIAEIYNVSTGERINADAIKGEDMDAKQLVKALARHTGRTEAEVERAIALTLAEYGAAKAATAEPPLRLTPIAESQHAAVKAAKSMTGSTRQAGKQRSDGRDMYGRRRPTSDDREQSRRSMFGERRDV